MPVYGTEATVARAIESVRSQTFTDFELLIINDHSKDNAREVVMDYLRKFPDSRIRFIENETNRGLAYTRNRGIDLARGRWLAFLDSDDTYKINFLETMLRNVEKVDVVIAGHELVYQDGTRRYRQPGVLGTYSQKQAQLAALKFQLPPFVWDKIFRRSAVGDLRFPEISRFEDAGFCISMMARVKKLRVIRDSIYEYSVNANSITWGSAPPPIAESFKYRAYIMNNAHVHERDKALKNALAVTWTFNCISSAQAAFHAYPKDYGSYVKGFRTELDVPILFHCLKGRPTIGLAGALLKFAPVVYAGIYKAYLRLAYRI